MKRVCIGVFAVLLVATGCSRPAPRTAAVEVTASPRGPEKPRRADDFERTCADGLGYAGLPAYTKAPGVVHRAVMMEKRDDAWREEWLTGNDYPATWFLDTGEAPDQVELVVCVEQVRAFPNGKTCRMEHRDTKKPFTLTMFDTSYLVRILEARSGRTLLYHAGTAKSQDCPMLTFNRGDEDPTKYYTTPDAKDYRPLIRPFIAP